MFFSALRLYFSLCKTGGSKSLHLCTVVSMEVILLCKETFKSRKRMLNKVLVGILKLLYTKLVVEKSTFCFSRNCQYRL